MLHVPPHASFYYANNHRGPMSNRISLIKINAHALLRCAKFIRRSHRCVPGVKHWKRLEGCSATRESGRRIPSLIKFAKHVMQL